MASKRFRPEYFSSSSNSDEDTIICSEYESGSEQSSDDIFSSDDSSDEDENGDLSDARFWCKLPSRDFLPPPMPFRFNGSPGMKISVQEKDNPLCYFELFFDDDVINHITEQTNLYAAQNIANKSLTKFSRSKYWTDVTTAEMRIFLATLILQGIVQKPQELLYWSKNKLIHTPSFCTLFSERRYRLIMQYLHFDNNDIFDPSTHPQPKLRKIWTIFNFLERKFKSVYLPKKDICVDESLMLYKGRLSWVQYLPLKRAKFGIKFFLLCESDTGYVWSVIIYVGKGTHISDEYKDCSMGTKIVMTLAKPLLNMGYCITMDNFYNSPELGELLIRNRTDFYGTFRLNRKDIPEEIKNTKLKKGEIVSYQKGKMMIMRWRDKKDVQLISSVHNNKTVSTVSKSGEEKVKPKIVLDYNNTMGGVDLLDQQVGYYQVTRLRQKKYYKKIFRHLLDLAIFNAFKLYQFNENRKTNLQFRLELVEKIIEKYHKPRNVKTKPTNLNTQSNILRLTERHFPDYIPPTPKKKEPTRRCIICCSRTDSSGKKIRKETRTYCKDCDVGLCTVPCFKIFHTQKEF